MGRADYYAHGDWNGICDICGSKFKFSQLHKTWNNLFVCARDLEPRQPQDLIRGRPDNQSVPAASPEPADGFLGTNEVTVDEL